MLALVLLIPFLPACWRRKPSHVHNEEVVVYQTEAKKPLFVEDVEAFELSEDADPFAGVDQTSGMTYNDVSMADQVRSEFKTIYFDFDRSAIRPDQRAALELNLARIKKATNQGSKVMIEGHACNSAGSTQYNLMLSEKRAQVVADYLIKQGVSASMIQTVGRGDTMCMVKGGTQEQQAPNRRVEFYILN